MTVDEKAILEKAKQLGDEWISKQSYTGNYDLNAIHKHLVKRTHEVKSVLTFVVKDPDEAVKALAFVASLFPEEKDIKKKFENAYQCVWDYYLQAFYCCSYQATKGEIQNPIEFAEFDFAPAFEAGLGFLINLGSVAIGVARPEAHRDDQFRLHNENGPSIVWGKWKTWHWHGVEIPKEWIEDKENLDPKLALTEENVERRRAVAEMVGWDKVLDVSDAKELCSDERGTLFQLDIDGHLRKFVTFTCPSTGRRYAHCVDESCSTPTEAVAWMWGETSETFHPDVET